MNSGTESLADENLNTLTPVFSQHLRALEAIANKLPVVVIVIELASWNVEYLSPNGLNILGFSMEEIQAMGKEYHTAFFNPEDSADYGPKLLSLIDDADDEKFISYFQQVRASPAHDWSWYLSTAKVFMRNEKSKPTHMICTASPVDPLHHVTSKVNRLLEENNFLRRNQKIFASLTKREKEILKLMALGDSSVEIAGKLHISQQTASTHRRNIKSKLKVESNYDVVKFAQAFDLI